MRDRNSEQVEKNRSACKLGTTKANKPKQTPATTIQPASLTLVLSVNAPHIACPPTPSYNSVHSFNTTVVKFLDIEHAMNLNWWSKLNQNTKEGISYDSQKCWLNPSICLHVGNQKITLKTCFSLKICMGFHKKCTTLMRLTVYNQGSTP
jgi:hypothetical protein